MEEAIAILKKALEEILEDALTALYLFGSVTTGDFQLGWSDIDILCLTNVPLDALQKDALLMLRQRLLEAQPDNPYYRSFEGGILPLSDFTGSMTHEAVYWGTSGQRITDRYVFDCFSLYELISNGILVSGTDVRSQLTPPSYSALCQGVQAHYDTIRAYAAQPDESLYACGWLLDISRCLYTLQTGRVLSKTAAGQWALDHHYCPDEAALSQALQVRRNPLLFKSSYAYRSWAVTLGPSIQSYADVLQEALEKALPDRMALPHSAS